MNKKLYPISTGILVLIFSFLISSCGPKTVYYEETGSVFHTLYQIKYESPVLLTEKIDAELQAFNLSLNPFNPNSIISKVNRNEPVEVDEWFKDVFLKSMEISANSGGVFDATAAPLINLWGFGFSKMDSVTPAMVDSIKEYVGYRKIRLNGNRIEKDDPRIMLTFSAIAKGYASDVIARLLEREGVTNYMVNIGGEAAMQGVNPNGDCWRLGINEPEDNNTTVSEKVKEIIQPCIKCGIATSGDYRNYYIKDGKKYAHTINPHTGYPAEQKMLSATIVAGDCMTADGYATAFMAMGVEQAIEMAASLPEIEYFIIYLDEQEEEQILYSRGMINYLPNRKTLSILENP